MASNIWRFANPHNFMRLSGALLPWVAVAGVVSFVIGLIWSLAFTPPHSEQGDNMKIFFIHVPAAMMSVNIYAMMVVASLIGLIRGHPVSHLAAKAAAPIGAAFTIIAIVSGALWGMRTWGAWWVWDARLTAVLVLFFFYMGYIALWNAIEDPVKAADLAAILCLFGSVFAFLSRYAAYLWNTLHQGSSMSLDRAEHIADVYFAPLLVMILAHYLIFVALLLVGVRTEIRARRIRALRLSSIASAAAGERRTPQPAHG